MCTQRLLALAAITAVLAGCASAPDDDPAAATTAAATTASTLPSTPKPSATRVATASSAPTVEPVAPETAAEVTAPATTPPAAPAAPPAGEPAIPEATAAASTIEAGPEPVVPTGVVVTPHPEWRASTATVTQGSSVTINGSGYEPGQKVFIGMGVAQTDGFVMDDQVATAGAAGAYSFTIAIEAGLPPRTYAVLTYVEDYGRGGPDFEATKRYSVIDVVAP